MSIKGFWLKQGHIGDFPTLKAEKICEQLNGVFASPIEVLKDGEFMLLYDFRENVRLEYRLGDPENGKPGYRGIYSYLWQEEKK